MEIVLVLLIVWFFVTVIGHGTWIALRGLIRMVSYVPNRSTPVLNQGNDIEATRRVVNRMVDEQLIDGDAASSLRTRLRELELGPISQGPLPARPTPQAMTSETGTIGTEEVIEAILVDADVSAASSLSPAQLIGSFLASRNIRWGELVAGMLIVICSIGLVVSLWSTLVDAHRAIPSLIFLAANAAIYAGGFYTLAKWKLRHTSRAVLVIATMLVPLSVLTGLAAVGAGEHAVRLTDPITLAVIMIASVVYGYLLYRGGRALVRRRMGAALAVAVAGPAAVLPIMPAAVRAFNADAGWLIGVGSIAVAIAVTATIRATTGRWSNEERRDQISGKAMVRARLMVIGLGLFSLAVLIGYGCFSLQRFGAAGILAIAIATIPALIAIAGVTRELTKSSRGAAGSMAAAVVGVIAVGASTAILPAAMASTGWLWAWAIAMTTSFIVVGRILRLPEWMALATIPLGMTAMLTSPTLIGGIPWAEVRLIDHITGEFPMFAASMMGLISVIAAWLYRPDPLRKWMGLASCVWLSISSLVAVGMATSTFAKLHYAIFRGDSIDWTWSIASTNFGVPASALLLSAIALWMVTKKQSSIVDNADRNRSVLQITTTLFTTAAVTWPITNFASSLHLATPEMAVLTTSLISIVSLLLGFRYRSMPLIGWLAATTVTASSVVLLSKFLVEPLIAGRLASSFPTVAVSFWWIVAAAYLLLIAIKSSRRRLATISSILFAAAFATATAITTGNPFTWLQIGSLALITWACVMRWFGRECVSTVREPVQNAITAAIAFGIATAIIAWGAIILPSTPLSSRLGFTGLTLSAASIGIAVLSKPRRWFWMDSKLKELSWPIGTTLMAGHVAWLTHRFGWVSGASMIEVAAAIALIGEVSSLFRFARSSILSLHDQQSSRVDLIHVGAVAVGLSAMAWAVASSSVLACLALIAITFAGAAIVVIAISDRDDRFMRVAARLLGWFVVIAGCGVLIQPIFASTDERMIVTVIVVWSSFWWCIWRAASANSLHPQENSTRTANTVPDTGLVAGLTIMAFGEIAMTVVDSNALFSDGIANGKFLFRLVAFLAIPIVGYLFGRRGFGGGNLIAISVAAGSLIAVHSTSFFESDWSQRWMVAILSSSFIVAFVTHCVPRISATLSRDRSEKLLKDMWQVALVVAIAGIGSAVMMLTEHCIPWVTQLTALSVAMSAWTFAMLAEMSNQTRWRHVAIGLSMSTLGLLASTSSTVAAHPILEASMRWLVASVFAIPVWLFVLPKLVGEIAGQRWNSAFRGGAVISAVAAIGSLSAMLGLEFWLHENGEIAGISKAMVVGVAIVLAMLSVLAGAVAVLSGPDSSSQRRFTLADQRRRDFVVAAQIIAGLTWLHVFLCKSPWSLLGLREHWPLIVMGLAFTSVGVTEWARRRGDRVISDTLKQTSLYLPLIPVIGFWLSSGWLGTQANGESWSFIGGRLRYDALLVVAAVYYIAVSMLWRTALPKVFAVVLGNAALWVMLVQQPGWNFLSHPQAWLIPPCVCVLAVTHFYRTRLDAKLLATIRYAATLVIYISSTADILLQQIGTSLAGPIVLVLLAMAGMLAGVVFRVGPFLYLGATFVFIGVTSMVWHAQRSIDAVWPWWVFGITTGILLLVGLTFLEKNHSRLKSYAQSLTG